MNTLLLNWADKKNSYILAEFIAKYGAEYCMTAEEINEMRDTINAMVVIQQSTFMGTVEPTGTPTGTGNRYWVAVTSGTYTNFGSKIVTANSLAIISVTEAGVFSISQTVFDFSSYATKTYVVDYVAANGGKTATWIAQPYASGSQVVSQGKYWVSNVATIATDVPGTSTKWVEMLSGYKADGAISIGNTKAVSGDTVYPLLKSISNKDALLNSGEFTFIDFNSYTNVFGTSTMSSGLKIVTAGDCQIATGKVFDSSISTITLKGTCKVSNAAYFGIGLKTTTNWGGMMYRGSSGARAMLDYASGSFKTGAILSTTVGYVVDDVVQVQLQLIEGLSYSRTSVNGVWSALEATGTVYNQVNEGGEVHICFRGATTWDNVSLEVVKEGINKNYYVSKTGSDTNNGLSESKSFLTISKAVAESKGINKIIVSEGDYYGETFTLKTGINLKGKVGKRVRIIKGNHITSASLVSGYTKVYSVAQASALTLNMWLWQHDVKDEATAVSVVNSHPLHRGLTHRLGSTKCTWKAGLAELEASNTARSYFYWSGGTLYFTIASGTNLIANPIVVPTRFDSILCGNSVNIKMNNIDFLYTPVSLEYSNFEITDCANLYSVASYGWQYGNCVGGVFRRCRAGGVHYNDGDGGDGFNGSTVVPITSNSRCTDITSFDSWAHDCYDDGDSLHNNANSSAFGGLYEFNGSAITAASGGNMSVYNAMIRNNTNGLGAQGTPPSGYLNTSILANGCLFLNNTRQNTANTGDDTVILINCVSKGNPFVIAGVQLYNCVNLG